MGIEFFAMIMGQVLGGGYNLNKLEDSSKDYELNGNSQRIMLYNRINFPEKYIKLFSFEFGFFFMKIAVPGGDLFGAKGSLWANTAISKSLLDENLEVSLGVDNLFDIGGFQMKRSKPLLGTFDADGNEFEKHYLEIYPPELQLKKENVTNTETNFLELNINISENSLHTKIYDKRDSFGFHISRLPFKSSNIPNRMFYSSISAEILRICRASSKLVDAIASSNSLHCRMKTQGANFSVVKGFLRKSLNKYQITLKQYNITSESFINELNF